MAQGLGFIEFSTGDVLSAAAANGYLASQTVMVFANAAARTSAITTPYEGMFSYLKDTNATEYYTGSAWAALSAGGGGKVLQVVQATSTTSTAMNSSTYADTTLTATITPSAATSKVLVMTFQNFTLSRSTTADANCRINLLRGATEIFARAAATLEYNNDSSMTTGDNIIYLDSPATTSATTYKTQQKTGSTSHTITSQPSSQTSVIVLMEIGA